MNAVEIEEAVSNLVVEPFDPAEFPYQFLSAFGFSETTLKKLRANAGTSSDVPGAVLLRNQIHLAVVTGDEPEAALDALRQSARTAKGKVKFILATNGDMVVAEEMGTGEALSRPLRELPDDFGFFLPLAGISTVAEIRENPIDVKATGRLNKIYVELLKDNPDWATAERRPALNQFMARLVFCFFAEDTSIFLGEGMFSRCVRTMSDSQSQNTHEVLAELFRAMNTPDNMRQVSKIKSWADSFPYVNGGLFGGSTDCPRFSKIARSYLLRAGELDWKQINPDIFGSMIQAVADDEERGSLGMHYTSVPNILKILDPLFLEELRSQLVLCGDNARKLLNLRKRIAAIRVFDPACGSGNFLVIAYIKLRELEADICARRKDRDADRKSWIKLTNFHGIEIKSFPAEIARLALLIAEFQCDVRHIGQLEACRDVLPLHNSGKILCGNALQVDWREFCPPPGIGDTVFEPNRDLRGIESQDSHPNFEGPGAETYICGNPPYLGSVMQTASQKADLKSVFGEHTKDWKSLDYVAAWFFKATLYGMGTTTASAFVATNSICQGEQVPILWPLVFSTGQRIRFAYRSFTWSNLASQNAGVTVVIVGLSRDAHGRSKLFDCDPSGNPTLREVDSIGPYLTAGSSTAVKPLPSALDERGRIIRGNMPNDGGHLVLTPLEADEMRSSFPDARKFVRYFVGSQEFIRSTLRYCIWINDENLEEAMACPPLRERIQKVREVRLAGGTQARDNAATPHRFVFAPHKDGRAIVVPRVSSERRNYLPVGVLSARAIVSDNAFALYDAPLWNMAVIASKLHLLWIATVCGKLKTDFRYSNTLGWNTFPVPVLTENDRAALTNCAEDILLAREAHFPATIAELYEPDSMPDNLRAAHDKNDETLERIYIGRRFKNDTERLEKLFEMYVAMTAEAKTAEAAKPKKATKTKPAKSKRNLGETA